MIKTFQGVPVDSGGGLKLGRGGFSPHAIGNVTFNHYYEVIYVSPITKWVMTLNDLERQIVYCHSEAYFHHGCC